MAQKKDIFISAANMVMYFSMYFYIESVYFLLCTDRAPLRRARNERNLKETEVLRLHLGKIEAKGKREKIRINF